jgi:riboflavin kinase/FMN adenylyltransferase
MIIINKLENLKELGPLCVALGSFDGLHKGHQRLIKRCAKLAEEKGCRAAVFSFSNHPLDVIKGEGTVRRILSEERKAEILEQLGIDILIAPTFTRDIMEMSPERFVKELIVDNMDMVHAFCGFNYSFGYKASGSPKELRALGRKYGFSISVSREYRIDGVTASSTELRHFIAEGDEASYIKFTGRSFKDDSLIIP